MSPVKHVPHPERLLDGKFGGLLRDANREFASELDQRAAFRRVTERLPTSRALWPRRAYLLVPAMVLLILGFIAVPAILHRVHVGDPALVAEDLSGFRAKTSLAGSAVAGTATSLPVESAKGRRSDGKSALGTKLSVAASSSSTPRSSAAPDPVASAALDPVISTARLAEPAAAPAPASSESGTAPDCLSLARRGQTRDAEACFLKRAEGSGLGAEMALYEVARLRRDVLADAPGALAALAEYRSRFPAGSLRREADMSQLELLLQLGRSDEALKQSDGLLSSSASGERAAELHLLRGHILRKTQSRFAEAEHEYDLAESAGMRGGDIPYFRALCLEALGRGSEAAALFAQYLEQPQRTYAKDAGQRLQRLKP